MSLRHMMLVHERGFFTQPHLGAYSFERHFSRPPMRQRGGRYLQPSNREHLASCCCSAEEGRKGNRCLW